MATSKKTKTPATKKVASVPTAKKIVSTPTSTTKKSAPTPQKTKVETPVKAVEKKPVITLENTTHEQAYLSISIALTGVLYFILLFLTYIYFNYDIMLFPKA